MKNIIINTIFIIGISMMIISLMGIVGYAETHYNRQGIIIDIIDNTIVIEDKSGNLWGFEGPDYSIGQEVEMEMYTNATDNNTMDDEVINIK